MGQPSFLKQVVMLAAVSLVSACSQAPFQLQKDAAEPSPVSDCSRNYSSEMSFVDGWEYKTWARYNDVDFKRAVEAAELSVREMGYRVTRVDREAGTITAEKVMGTDPRTVYPMKVSVEQEDSTLVVYLSAKAARGTMDASNLCRFYAEFEKGKSRPVAQTSPRADSIPAQKPKGPSQPMPSPGATVPKPIPPSPQASQPSLTAAPPPPPAASPAPQRTAQVKWANVNLREGPGMNFKVVDNIKKGTSLSVLEEKGDWFHIRLADGKEAWLFKTAISEETSKSNPQPSPSAPKSKPAKVASPMLQGDSNPFSEGSP